MKTIEVKVYSINELNETAKQNAYENWLNKGNDYFWEGENRDTLNKFADIFPVKIKNFEYGYHNFINWEFTESDEIAELSGIRLLKYLWNNYKTDIYKGRFYHSQKFGLTDHKLKHNRVKSREITNNCPNKGKFSNSYYSAIQLENSCPLTGYCVDDDTLQPVFDFMKKPDSTTFEELMGNCLDNWLKACENDYEYSNSMEFFLDQAEANEYEFTEDGELF